MNLHRVACAVTGFHSWSYTLCGQAGHGWEAKLPHLLNIMLGPGLDDWLPGCLAGWLAAAIAR